MQVEIWSDVVCPWCYLGKRRLDQALDGFAARDDVEVLFRSFELDPSAERGVTRTTVEMLSEKYGMTPQQAADAERSMEQRAAADGLTFHMESLRSGSTRDAHRLLHLAKDRGRQPELAERLHAAHFTDGASIFDSDALVGQAVAVGLDEAEALAVLSTDAYDDAVETDEAMARELGVTGVPFFVIDRRYAVSGAQPAELLAQALQQAWDERAA